jgi:hypothetical protein
MSNKAITLLDLHPFMPTTALYRGGHRSFNDVTTLSAVRTAQVNGNQYRELMYSEMELKNIEQLFEQHHRPISLVFTCRMPRPIILCNMPPNTSMYTLLPMALLINNNPSCRVYCCRRATKPKKKVCCTWTRRITWN